MSGKPKFWLVCPKSHLLKTESVVDERYHPTIQSAIQILGFLIIETRGALDRKLTWSPSSEREDLAELVCLFNLLSDVEPSRDIRGLMEILCPLFIGLLDNECADVRLRDARAGQEEVCFTALVNV